MNIQRLWWAWAWWQWGLSAVGDDHDHYRNWRTKKTHSPDGEAVWLLVAVMIQMDGDGVLHQPDQSNGHGLVEESYAFTFCELVFVNL